MMTPHIHIGIGRSSSMGKTTRSKSVLIGTLDRERISEGSSGPQLTGRRVSSEGRDPEAGPYIVDCVNKSFRQLILTIAVRISGP